jgi:signal transduction histidine kinase
VLTIAIADHLSGSVLSFALLYALPIAAAAWFVSARFAILLSVVAVLLWLGGDLAAGERWTNLLIPVWNGTVRLGSYFIFVAMLSGLHGLRESLEARVIDRTAALRKQIAERERLERELLGISEREQRRLGQDLHDSLCQHLTGTALASQVLAQKLAARDVPEARSAENIARLIEDAIAQSRNLARGLSPVELQAEGLVQALEEFATTTSDLFKVSCSFKRQGSATVTDKAAAGQLYRIAQEAVGNAIKHGRAEQIAITLVHVNDSTELRIEDDGIGLPEPLPRNGGMGLRIMSHRANVIGGTFEVMRGIGGGTLVRCALPLEFAKEEPCHA